MKPHIKLFLVSFCQTRFQQCPLHQLFEMPSIDFPINGETLLPKPLKLSGALDKFKSFDVTPVIGREFPDLNLVALMESPESDALLRDLAITSKVSPL